MTLAIRFIFPVRQWQRGTGATGSMCASGRSFRLSLRILVNHALQASTVTAAAGQFLAGLEDDDIFATIDGYQFLNLPHIHDGGAVDADEEIRVQPFGDTADSFPKEIR